MAELRCIAGLRQEAAPIPGGIFCTPGKVVVAVHVTDEPEQSFVTADDIGNRGYTDVGTIIAANHRDYQEGDVVILKPRYGKYITNFRAGGLVYGCVRFLGDEGKGGIPQLYDPGDCILAKVDMGENKIIPKGGRVLVKRDGYMKEYGALALPDGVGNRSGEALVMAVSSDVHDVQVGDTVICHAGSFDRAMLPQELADAYGCSYKDLAFIDETSIYAVIER